METIEHILAELRSIHQNNELASRIEEAHRASLTEKAQDISQTWERLLNASQLREHNATLLVSDLRAKLKLAEDALVKMSSVACSHCDLRDACYEGEDGISVPCNDMIAIRDALTAIREEGPRNRVEIPSREFGN